MTLRFHEISEANHRILNPFTESKLIQLGEICRLKTGMNQLDLACGKGEMLCQWAKRFGITGTGVDISAVFLEAAKKRAAEFGVSGQVQFIQQDAVGFQGEPESYDVVSCIGANWIGGGTRGTLELLKQKGVKKGAHSLVLMGEIFWRMEPPQEALDALGVNPDEWAVGLDGLLSTFKDGGTRLVEMILATDSDWDRYESMHWWAVDQWCRQNPDDPDLDQLIPFLEESRLDYFRYERPLCDWGVFVLRLDD
jgi:SAM-dependent methyltransferase